MNNFYVYIWYNPITNLPFYVGKGKNKRAYNVSKKARSEQFFEVYNDIINNGYEPYVVIEYANLTEEQSLEKENELIHKYGMKHDGGILTNLTWFSGGKSNINDATREKLSKLNLGENNSMCKYSEYQIEQCFIHMTYGLSNKNIGLITGVPAYTVSDLRYGKKWKHVYEKYKNKIPNIKIPNSKYNFNLDKQIDIITDIISYLNDGRELKALTEKYNITYEYLMSIRLKRVWKSVWKKIENKTS